MAVSKLKARRSRAQVAALRRYALTWAWDQAYHVVACHLPGTRNLLAEARSFLAQGWVEAKLAERYGHLVVEDAAVEVAAPAPRPVAFIRAEVEDLENHDRLGAFGLARLSALRAELFAAEHRAAA